ncbi:NADH dehydrogenase I chain D [Sinorhizobium fredii HH103]|uniref:NADH-quinone oxidoreductase subunit D n=2 Tax=Rhizobium fredii TaxID=380 RepID=G9A8L8_SINF1|nr:NADH dehydrogenase I chain D [Sinorhizobium fredii HH103]
MSAKPGTCTGSASRDIPTCAASTCGKASKVSRSARISRSAATRTTSIRSAPKGRRRPSPTLPPTTFQQESARHRKREMTEVTELMRPQGEALDTKEVLLNLGPQHPSTHGVLRLVLELDGEYVARVDPHIGYLHRGTEKLAESFTYTQIFPLTDRLDYVCPPSNNLAFALAVEKLLGIEAPIRAQYIRVMMAELARISGHLLITGALPMDLGAMTALLYAMREREMIMDLLEMITGARMHTSFCRVGGVREDLPEGFLPKIREFCEIFPNRIRDYERLLEGNRVFLSRTQGIGVISPEVGIDLGLSGPNLRASGVNWDIRRDEPYEIYDRLDFNVITRKEGDCYARWQCRVEEMRESVRLIEQCLDQMPEGPFQVDMPTIAFPMDKDRVHCSMEALIQHFDLSAYGFKVPKGEVYSAIEAPKGELGFYIISDGTEKPFRMKVRAPSFVNLQALFGVTNARYLADMIAVLGSLDPVMAEVDK